MISILSLILTILTPLTCFLVHAVLFRLPAFRNRSRWGIAILAIAVGVALTGAGALYFSPDVRGFDSLFVFFVAGSLGHVYFHFFNMSETARRIRILIQIRRGEAPYAAATDHLFVPQRLARLLAAGCIRQERDHYFLIPSLKTRLFLIVRAYEKLLYGPARS